MATTITQNYAGEVAAGYVAASVLAGNTLANREITIHEGVHFKMNIKEAALSGIIQTGGCDFADQGTATITEKVLQVTDLKVNKQECAKTWLNSWESAKRRAGRNNQDVPAEFSDWLIGYMGELVALDIEGNLWQGNVTGSSYTNFDGIEKTILDAGTAQEIDAVAGGITAANVQAEVEKVYDLIPNAIINHPDLRIYVSNKVARAYKKSIGAADYLQTGVVGDKPLDYLGVPLVVANGMTDDAMIAGLPSFFHFGTDLTGDFEEVRVVDMRETDGSENMRFIMKFMGGVQVTNLPEVVLYHPDVTP